MRKLGPLGPDELFEYVWAFCGVSAHRVNNLKNCYKGQPTYICTEWITQIIRERYHILPWCWANKTDFLLDIAVPE